MRKIAFVFPGQGSQYVGMGKEFFEEFPSARAVFEEGDRVLGRSISEICFNGPEETLKDTRNAQPALLLTSVAILRVVAESGIKPDFVAGHSLGEYSALVAAQALTLAEALPLVQARAIFMAEADPGGKGSMAAVLGLDREKLAAILATAEEAVEAANFNCPGQIVISGTKTGLAKIQEMVNANGGKFIPLAVSGAFHSSFMKEAAERYLPVLQKVAWKEPTAQLVANINALPVKLENLTENLYKQLFSPVLWEDTLYYLRDSGVEILVEIGPGKVLTGLIKKTLKGATVFNCEDLSTLKKALAFLKEV